MGSFVLIGGFLVRRAGANSDMDSVACFSITFPCWDYLKRPQRKRMHSFLIRLDMLAGGEGWEAGRGKQGKRVGLGGEGGGATIRT